MYRLQDVISYLSVTKEVTWPWTHPLQGQSIMHALAILSIDLQKNQRPSFTRSKDIIGAQKFLKNGLHDHDQAPL